MFVITASECLIVRLSDACMVLILLLCHVCDHSMWVLDGQNSTCIHGAHYTSVSCLWSQYVSAWLSEFCMHPWCSFHFVLCLCSKDVSAWLSEFCMHPWCSFCFGAVFVIKGCKCLIVRILHVSMMLILLLCHVCHHSLWVLDCQISIYICDAHSVCVPCLSLQYVSAWLSEFHMHPWCSLCFCAMFVIIASKCLMSEFQIHPWCSFYFGVMFVIKGCKCLIVRILHASMVLILLLCYVCDQSEWVLDCQNSAGI